ncbi:MAG: hypothetical protein WCA11_08130 [Terracidiphilus sp.]
MPVILTRTNLLHLNGFTRVERLTSVARLREAIVGSHGWVTDFHLFSNLSICLQFEIPIEHLPLLAESLLDAGVKFNPRSEALLYSFGPEMATGPIQCTLQVLFIHNEPDLRRKVLAVPG